jgi:hypothetical protein
MSSYILNCTSTPNYLLPAETVEATKPIAIAACKARFTEKGAYLIPEAIANPEIFAIHDSPLQAMSCLAGKSEMESEAYSVESALTQIFSNHGMAFGSGVVILDTDTRIGQLVQIALQNKRIKTLALSKKN